MSTVEAINNAGYGWFLDHFVNSEYGKWPLIRGSAAFIKETFDPAALAGNKYSYSQLIFRHLIMV